MNSVIILRVNQYVKERSLLIVTPNRVLNPVRG